MPPEAAAESVNTDAVDNGADTGAEQSVKHTVDDFPDNTPVPEDKKAAPSEQLAEDYARSKGWVNEAEWVKKGNNAEDHRSAEMFNERGSNIAKGKQLQSLEKRLDSMERNTDQRIATLNKLHASQRATLEAQLNAEKEGHIKDANVEAVAEIDKQLASLPDTPSAEAQPYQDPVYARWQSENDWVNTHSPKSVYARERVEQYMGMGHNPENVVKLVDQDLAREYGKAEAPTPPSSMAEGGSKSGAKPTEKSITMSDLTASERRDYDAIDWPSDKIFLQAVKDNRSGE